MPTPRKISGAASVALVTFSVLVFSTQTASADLFPAPGQTLKLPKVISNYAAGELKCWNGGTLIVETHAKKGFTVFQYSEDPKHIWIEIIGTEVSGDLVIGSDASCLFTGTRSSPLAN